MNTSSWHMCFNLQLNYKKKKLYTILKITSSNPSVPYEIILVIFIFISLTFDGITFIYTKLALFLSDIEIVYLLKIILI